MAQARGLILAGSAAGIAAAFNTPLAGIVFAIEEMGRSYQARTNGVVLSAVILAGLASLGLMGSYTYFGKMLVSGDFPRDWLLVAVCGIVGGALGAVFGFIMLKGTRRLRRWLASGPLKRTLIFAGFCGLGIAGIGLLSDGQTFGTGYVQARSALNAARPSVN
jgi:H+/Cl- antiporter ClcA